MSAIDAYRTAAREEGIPEDTIDAALRFARPRLELRPIGDSDAPVAGQWGGHPWEAYVMLARAAYSFEDVAGQCAAFWLIRRRDLAERNFADVILVVQDYG